MPSNVTRSSRARRLRRMRLSWLVALLLILAPSAGLWAGNEKMVEERTREMEELNRRAIEEIPDIPEEGTIQIKADGAVREGEIRFDIREHSTTSTVREGESQDNETKTEAPKNEIIQFRENNNETTHTEGRDGEDDPVEN